MPYKTRTDLPKGVKNNLPKGAQEIYKAAFNSAWESYDDPEERTGSRDQTAHRVAWSAVKKSYEKTDNGWHKKEEE